MKQKSIHFGIIGVCLLMLACSCKIKDQSAESKKADSLRMDSIRNIELKQTVGFDNDTSLLATFYQIPSPEEVLTVFNDEKNEFKQKLLLPTEHYKNLIDIPNKAINFGSYSADLAYCIASKQYQISATYYATVRKLSENLGITNVIDQAMKNRIENNLNNLDTLQKISNETYNRTIDKLVEIDNGKTLTYITVGGFIESIYLMTNITNQFVKDAPQNQQLADLKNAIDNVLKCTEFFAEDKQFSTIILQLKDLKTFYDQLTSDGKQKNTSIDKKDDKLVVAGGQQFVITEKQFTQIKEKIRIIRKQIIEEGIK